MGPDHTVIVGIVATVVVAGMIPATSTMGAALEPAGVGERLYEACEGYEDHPPIEIREDHGPLGFTWKNPITGQTEPRPGSGVTSGSGTPGDPFVIEGWCILASASVPNGTETDGVQTRHESSSVQIQVGGHLTKGVRILDVSSHAVVRDVAMVDSRLSEGVHLHTASNVTVTRATINGTAIGIHLSGSPASVVHNNTVTNGSDAIAVESSPRASIQNNTLSGQLGDGLELVSSGSVYVANNTLTGAGDDGIRLDAADDVTVANNTVVDLGGDGIHLSEATTVSVENNTISGAAEVGIRLVGRTLPGPADPGTPRSEDVRMDANAVTRNDVGVRVRGQAPGTVLRVNNVHDNREGVGLAADDGLTPTVDAEFNWWGCPGGPSQDACDAVEGNADADPWLPEPNPQAGAGG